MTKTKNIYLGALAVLFLPMAAQADSIRIEGPAEVSPGSSFELSLIGSFAFGLLNGGVTFSWDDTLVQLDNVMLNLPVDPGLSCPGGFCPPDTANSTEIVWGEFIFAVIEPGDPFDPVDTLMATLSFTATAIASGPAVFSMVDSVFAGPGGWDDAFAVPIPVPDLGDFTVTVPEPGTLALLGIGLLGMGLARRRKTA